MMQWFKKLFAKEEPAAVPPAKERHLVYLERYFSELQKPDVTREEKARLRYAIKDRQTRLIKAGLTAPDNLAQCQSMLIAYGHGE